MNCRKSFTIQEVWPQLGVAEETRLRRKVVERIHQGKASPERLMSGPDEIYGFFRSNAVSAGSRITLCVSRPGIEKGGDRHSSNRPWRNRRKEVTTWK